MELFDYPDWVAIPRTATESWFDYDLDNAGCPANTIGVICTFARYSSMEGGNFGDGNLRAGIRPNGSTDDGSWMWYSHQDAGSGYDHPTESLQICGCDANKIIEVYLSSAADLGDSQMYVIGFLQEGDAHLLTNALDATWHSGPTTGQWGEASFDAAIQGGDTPQAWIVKTSNVHWNNDDFQPRPKGSSYSNRTQVRYEHQFDRITGAGTSNRIEYFVGDTANQKLSVRGYIKTGYTSLYDSPIDYNTGVNESWQTVNLPGVPADAFAIFENDSTTSSSKVGVRPEGSSNTRFNNTGPGPLQQIVSVGPNQRVEANIRYQMSGQHYVTGYIESASATPPTYQDRQNYFGDSVNVNLATGWVDADPNDFSASNLPNGLSMSAQGVVTGNVTASGPGQGDYYPPEQFSTTVTNSGVESAAFTWDALTETIPPVYQDQTYYFDTDIGTVDLAAGWQGAIPDGFTADQLPHGLTLSATGQLTGIPVCPPPTQTLGADPLYSTGTVQSLAIVVIPPVYELTFNNSRIDTGVVLSPQSEYVIECTINTNDSGSDHRGIFGCGDPIMMLQVRSADHLRMRHWETKEGNMTSATTQDGVEILVRLHLPGSSGDATGTTIPGGSGTRGRGSQNSNSDPLIIGRAGNLSSNNYFRGTIKDFKIWTGNKGTLIHHWPIDDNSNTITDIVGNSDGTLVINNGSWNEV